MLAYKVRCNYEARGELSVNKPGGGGYSHCGLTGGSSQFEGLTNWLPNGPFFNHILPIRGILRFEAIHYVSTRYAPPHTNLVITASIINEF